MFKKILLLILFFSSFFFNSYAEKINKINIIGNERISKETIIVFGEINLNDDYDINKLNIILKKLYDTNFFKDVNINISNNVLNVSVLENPIIQNVQIKGIKAKKLKEPIFDSLALKKNNSYNEYSVKKDRDLFLNILKSNGFYFAEIKLDVVENDNNTVSLIYNVDLGKRAKIRKIKFIGNKIFKNRKLFRIIVSEEDKFWKFISQNKLLNQSRINLDTRLLKNYYRNKGYYNVKVESTFAELLDDGMFDLTFNINAGQKYYFNNLFF